MCMLPFLERSRVVPPAVTLSVQFPMGTRDIRASFLKSLPGTLRNCYCPGGWTHGLNLKTVCPSSTFCFDTCNQRSISTNIECARLEPGVGDNLQVLLQGQRRVALLVEILLMFGK